MNRIDENLWPIVEPPPGFADALVERMLANDSVKLVRPRSGYRLAGLLLAAIFVSGAAFGLSARAKKASANRVELAVPFANESATPMQQRILRVASPRIPPIIVPLAPRAPYKPVEPATTSTTPATVSSAPSSAPRIPPCQCQRGFADVICDCY